MMQSIADEYHQAAHDPTACSTTHATQSRHDLCQSHTHPKQHCLALKPTPQIDVNAEMDGSGLDKVVTHTLTNMEVVGERRRRDCAPTTALH
jgi:hypothetical protein